MEGLSIEAAEEVVNSLKSSMINFVAIDFDLTLVSEHTGGRFLGTAKDLVTCVRPVFQLLVPHLIDNGIMVAIVTFSGQTSLIKNVLRLAFGPRARHIVVRCRDNSWGAMGGMGTDGKQKFMASAAAEFEARSRGEASDHNNISSAVDIETEEEHEQKGERDGNNTFAYFGNGNRNGRNAMMDRDCAQPLQEVSITRNSTVLIDDDINNVRIALNNQVRAVPFYPNDPNCILQNLLGL